MLLAKTLRSTTFRLALLSIGIFGAAVLALFAYVYWATVAYVLAPSGRAVTSELAALRRVYDGAGQNGLTAAIAARIAAGQGNGLLYLLADGAFARLAGNLAAWPAGLNEEAGLVNVLIADGAPAGHGRMLARTATAALPGGLHLLVAKDVSELRLYADRIYAALAAAAVLILVLAAFASVIVTRRTVGRIEAVNATSRAIMESGLGTRIPLRGTQDEWDQLAANLNMMLARIETLMGEVKQATDNVAHDLRTPLARMRGRLERAGAGARDAAADQELIDATIAHLDDVLRIFAALTRISQIETGARMAGFRTVDLAGVAHEVAELFDAAAVETRCGRSGPVHCLRARSWRHAGGPPPPRGSGRGRCRACSGCVRAGRNA